MPSLLARFLIRNRPRASFIGEWMLDPVGSLRGSDGIESTLSSHDI